MKISELVKLRQSLIESLETVDSELDKLRSDTVAVNQGTYYYSDNKFIEVDVEVLATAILLSNPGITVNDLVAQLGISRATLYRNKDVVNFLKARRK